MKCGEVLSTDGFGRPTIRCEHDRPCPVHAITPESTTRAVLARDVDGHLVPMLVIVREWDLPRRAEYWVSGIGTAVLVPDRDRDGYELARDDRSYQFHDRRALGTYPALHRARSPQMRVAALWVHPDRWSEIWIQLVDVQGYVVIDADGFEIT